MREIKMDNYGPVARQLIEKARAENRPQTLALSTPAADALSVLQSMTDQNISNNRRVRMPHDAEALHAGLWLLFDYMTQSHDLSQKIATPSGSFWHGILHRREPDAGNAKYWFQRVGEHPICGELLADALEIADALVGPASVPAGRDAGPTVPAAGRDAGPTVPAAGRDAGPANTLAEKLRTMNTWDANWFVDRCTTAADPAATQVLLEIQRREWALLFDYNFKKAFA